MIIFLYGEDTYRLKQKLNEIVNHYKEVHKIGLDLSFIDFYQSSSTSILKDLKDSFNQISMFKEKKMAILLNPFSDADFKEEFLENSETFLKTEDMILFYQEGKVDERSALLKFLKKNAKCQKFEPLAGVKLKNWVKKEFDKEQAKISPEAVDFLVGFLGNDLWGFSNEIKKLVSFKNGKEIKKEDIKKIVRSKIETDIFETIEAIAAKDKKQALARVTCHIEKGDSPLYILSMISYQFRNLLIIKDLLEKKYPPYIVSSKSGLHPFVVKKSWALAQKFSFAELKKIYQKIFQADVNIKTGKIGPEAALETLIVEL